MTGGGVAPREADHRIARLRGDIENLIGMITLEGFREPDGIVNVLRQAIACDDQAAAARLRQTEGG